MSKVHCMKEGEKSTKTKKKTSKVAGMGNAQGSLMHPKGSSKSGVVRDIPELFFSLTSELLLPHPSSKLLP